MGYKVERSSLTGIEPVRQKLQNWRQSPNKSNAMPKELWQAAVELAKEHGPYRVGKELRLDCTKLRKLVDQSRLREEPTARAELQRPVFVELGAKKLLGQAQVVQEAVVELFDADGARLRLSLKGGSLNVEALARAFWRRESCCR